MELICLASILYLCLLVLQILPSEGSATIATISAACASLPAIERHSSRVLPISIDVDFVRLAGGKSDRSLRAFRLWA
jgi:hypothetical protein